MNNQQHNCGSWPDSTWTEADFIRKRQAQEACPACNTFTVKNMEEPNYRVQIKIYDNNTEEPVAQVDEYLGDNMDMMPQVQKALQSFFDNKVDFEVTHYPELIKNIENEQ